MIDSLTKEQRNERFEIRALKEEEIPAALALAWRVFSEFEAPVYPPEGVEEFRSCLKDDAYLNGIVYDGAFDGPVLMGILGIREETRHITFFFVESAYQRMGVGTRLFKHMTENFRGQTITLNSSPYGLPFYKALGFDEAGPEQTVNGIRFTPMIRRGEAGGYTIVKLTERRDLKEKAALWFSEKWGIPAETYRESIEASFSSVVPGWYLCMDGERIAGGMGVIENDFHPRRDLTPNVCAVFTEPAYRKQGIAGRLLDHICADMASHGIDTLYLLTGHTGFYERYGWEFYTYVTGDGEEEPSRMYIHRMQHGV